MREQQEQSLLHINIRDAFVAQAGEEQLSNAFHSS
jgi:hypothetical protein